MKRGQFFQESIYTEVQINASAARVWSIIIDFDKYASWNIPLLISGKCVIGEKLMVQANIPNIKPTVFTGRLLVCQEMEMLKWTGFTIVPALLTGIHTFEIIPINDNQVMFINRESFSGVSVPFLRKNLLRIKSKNLHTETNLVIKRISETLI